MTSQYRSAKNSTLAIAVGYADLYAVSDTTITQTGRAIEGFLLLLFSSVAQSDDQRRHGSSQRSGARSAAEESLMTLGGSSDHIAAVGPAGLGWLGRVALAPAGAEWSVVSANLPLYAVGVAADQRWRPLLWIAICAALVVLTLVGQGELAPCPAPALDMAPLGLWLLAGGLGLLPVGTRHWGGLTLTLLTAGGGLLALPLGVLLALGRRGDLPVLR